jgi:hypothetical protein
MKYRIRNDCEGDYVFKNAREEVAAILKSKGVAVLEVKEYENKRSLDANALYWVWLTAYANHNNKLGRKVKYMNKENTELIEGLYTKDIVHDVMRARYLPLNEGYIAGKTTMSEQLASTSKLSDGDMYDYMRKFDELAFHDGCSFPHPGDSEYMKYKEAQER